MIDDPIVEEVRRIRQEYAARFNYDPSAIVEDLKKSDSVTRNAWFHSRQNPPTISRTRCSMAALLNSSFFTAGAIT